MHKRLWFAEINKILRLAVPLIIANVAMIGMGVIDTMMAGQVSGEDLAGLAIGGNIWLVIEMTLYGIICAITPRVARFYGAKNYKEISIESQQGLLLAAFLGILATVLMLSLIPLIPHLGASVEVTKIAQGYGEIIAYSLPISGVCWALCAILEGHGLLRFVVISSLVAVSLNLFLDYVFVFGKYGFPALGGVGCAWTTTIIYWLWGFSAIIYTAKHKKTKRYNIYKKWPGIILSRWRVLLSLGLPISLAILAEEGFFNFTALLIAPLGTESLGAHQITIQVVSLVLMFGLGIGQATSILVAQSIGKSNTSAMYNHLQAGLSMVAAFGFLVGLLVFGFRADLPNLFTQDIAIAAISTAIMWFAPFYLVFDIMQVWAAQTLRGFEDTKVPMILQVTSYWLIGFPLGYSLAVTEVWGQSYGIYGFWGGFLVGIFLASGLLSTRLYIQVSKYKRA
ncbi:MATE family efflux transporter [Thalassotalea nanhaiensis]|uniref:Multidrug-efflux transporter n=1 Tax=Thalassotalea nanhaiensis TaxID=3065648 RepID=A0ABY9TJ72_9GAMM|nr:MATE family efflux transporter [Colwelliaceae bacterium SQ345]